MNPHETTADIYADLKRERNRPLWNLALRTGTIAALETRLAQLQAEAAETRTVESEILHTFNQRFAEEQVAIRYTEPLGADEYLDGQWIVDEGNNSNRLNP